MEYYLMERIAAFNRLHPEIKISIDGFVKPELLYSTLYTRTYHLAVLPDDDPPKDLETTVLLEKHMSLISPREGPLAIRELHDLKTLLDYPVISHPSDSALQPFIERQFARFGLGNPGTHMIGHYNALKKSVAMGMGVALADGIVCTEQDRRELNVIPMDDFFEPRTFYMAINPAMQLPKYVKEFVQYLKEHRQEPPTPTC